MAKDDRSDSVWRDMVQIDIVMLQLRELQPESEREKFSKCDIKPVLPK